VLTYIDFGPDDGELRRCLHCETIITSVSVTQQFNTTTSMGRLTLNVLLSFAQFEREVTGERIRDKIAASKAQRDVDGRDPTAGL
jgi:DNA invertase Pin-like site-specific DNA recombinase